jgi:hypothetical protein
MVLRIKLSSMVWFKEKEYSGSTPFFIQDIVILIFNKEDLQIMAVLLSLLKDLC